MALPIEELDRELTEYLPAREVMTTLAPRVDGQSIGGGDGHTVDGIDGNEFEGGLLNGVNVQDVLTDINVEEVQLVLINVLPEDFHDTLDLGTHNADEDAIVEE
jgi:hypothetical protein